jgi:hypothetical protein
LSIRIRALAAAVTAVAAAALGTPAAQAAKTAQVTCPAQPVSQIFSPWKDRSLYARVPGGGFDAGAPGWTLSGGASVTGDSQPLLGGAGGGSLQLGPGASATSPVFCVALGYPSGRAFARGVLGKAKVRVQVLHLAENGSVLRVGSERDLDAPSSGWAPTHLFSLSEGLADKLGGRVQLRFTLRSGQIARVDDIFADPRLAK